MSDQSQIPLRYCTELGHAAAQWVAASSGVDMLHIKGVAADRSLRPLDPATRQADPTGAAASPRVSTDADVLVRPTQVAAYIAAMQRNGWRVVTDFETGSPFRHAASLWHPYLGYVDVHRHFPGIGVSPAIAFDLLWTDRHEMPIAHQACHVPSVTAQRVLLLLHTARGGRTSDRQSVWDSADPRARQETVALVGKLKADVAFAAATGTLDQHVGAPDHDLWELYSTHRESDRWAEWLARLKASSGLRAKASVLLVMLRVNRGHLAMELGHEPNRRELAVATRRRVLRALRGLWRRNT